MPGRILPDVSILVLMDSRIKIYPTEQFYIGFRKVSILVLMDSRIKIRLIVNGEGIFIQGFNPCFNG